jgi:AraC-like DNA-binding protein
VHFILEGQLAHRLHGQTFVAKRNDAALFHLATPIRYENESRAPARFLWVLFDGHGMTRIFEELKAHRDPIVRGLARARTVAIFRELVTVVANEPPWYEAKVSALLGDLIAEMFIARPPASAILPLPIHPSSASRPVRSALEYMARYYYRPWSLKELSQKVGQSLYHLSHVFKEETGYSPMQYLNRYRIEQAKSLLVDGRLSVEEVARSVGVLNPKYFARLFRQTTGLTPRAFAAHSRPARSHRSPRR